MMTRLALQLIKFYTRFLSIFSFGSCRYYPTCSQYAIWQFENNNFFKAMYYTMLRIFRCNQLFKGGIDYPKINIKTPKKVVFVKRKIKYWLVPNGKNITIIKNREWKNG